MNDKLIRRLNNLKYAIDTVINAFEDEAKLNFRPMTNRSPEEIANTIYGVCAPHLRESCNTCFKNAMCNDIVIERDKALEVATKYKKALKEIEELGIKGENEPYRKSVKMWQIAAHALFEPSDIRGFVREYTDVKWSNFPMFTGSCAECTDRKKCAAHACSGCGARKVKNCNCATNAPYGTSIPYSECVYCGLTSNKWKDDPMCVGVNKVRHLKHSAV